LGISASYLSRLEAGELRPPSGSILHRFASFYKLNIQVLLDSAQMREHEVIAADSETAPFVQAFYRIAHDQSPDVQEKMIEGAIGALDLSNEQKKKLIDQFRAALSRSHGADLPRRATGRDDLFAVDIKPRPLSREQLRHRAERILQKIFGVDIPLPVPIEDVVRRYDSDIVLIVQRETEGGRLRDGSPAVLGFSRWSRDGERRELVVHEELFEAKTPAARRRGNFTLGHEFFHCIEHLLLAQQRHRPEALPRRLALVSIAPQFARQPWFARKRVHRTLWSPEDWREWQANQFAAELLMPAAQVRNSVEELFGATSLPAEESSIEEFADEIARTQAMSASGERLSLVDRFDVNPQAMAIRLVSLGLVTGN
jgi:Zn-dependent peptidase ImmA (M78 family)